MRTRIVIMTSVALLTLFSGMYAYATLGEGRRKSAKKKTALRLSNRIENTPGTFSLKSGYQYRGSSVLNEDNSSIRINTIVSLQKGNHVYTMPLKKEIWMNKVKVSLGNQSLRRP
ncbi:MAG: hypothetical protein ACKO6Q_01320 [Bacteroidota bacterium]